MNVTKVFSKSLQAYLDKYRIISNVGSTRSGKTFAILQLLYLIALKKENLTISVVSESIPHLKRGCIKDFKEIASVGIVDYNKTDRIYTFQTGSKIEFFSADNAGKLRGSQRDILFINECNNIDYESYKQLAIRTSQTIFLDYNPSSPFWIQNLKERTDFIEFHSTYKDNDYLSAEQIREIESNKGDARWWAIFGMGIEASSEGLVYPEFEIYAEAPQGRVIYGLDYGYNDPTALVKITEVGDCLYVEELVYKTKLSSDDIYKELKQYCGQNLIVADNARPEITMDLKRKGINIIPTKKGPNSIKAGIQFARSYKLFLKGKHLIDEARSYSYYKDDMGNYTEDPIDKNNHLMDAMRYGINYRNNGNYIIKQI